MCDLGKLDILCELAPGQGFDEIVADTVMIQRARVLTLERLIEVKSRAGRPTDLMAMPVLLAALDAQKRNQS